MIPKRYITQWFEKAPWQSDGQIEQDLILSRALVELYNSDILRGNLVFRGGTALNKLFFNPPLRYSEDIDLVQFKEGPIGEIMTAIRTTIDPWLGQPKWKQSQGRVTFYYRFETETLPTRNMKVKIEVNTREHDSVLGIIDIPFQVNNGWFSGSTTIKTYALEELIATKLRALFQRRKGRDLFDLYYIFQTYPDLNVSSIIHCFTHYLDKEGLSISRAEFEKNMFYKLKDAIFKEDIIPLLPGELKYDQSQAYTLLHKKLISFLPGNAWEDEKDKKSKHLT